MRVHRSAHDHANICSQKLFYLNRVKIKQIPTGLKHMGALRKGHGGHLTPMDFDIKFFPYHYRCTQSRNTDGFLERG